MPGKPLITGTAMLMLGRLKVGLPGKDLCIFVVVIANMTSKTRASWYPWGTFLEHCSLEL